MIVGFALLSTAGGLLCAYLYGFVGFLIALSFSYLCMILYVSGANPREIKPSWDTVWHLKLIRTGFPIMASGALFILLLNVDKIIIWIFMQRQDLGIYAIQSYITNFIMLAPGAVAMVLFPSMMEQIGKSNSYDSIENYLTHPTLDFGLLRLPGSGGLVFFIALADPVAAAPIRTGDSTGTDSYLSVFFRDRLAYADRHYGISEQTESPDAHIVGGGSFHRNGRLVCYSDPVTGYQALPQGRPSGFTLYACGHYIFCISVSAAFDQKTVYVSSDVDSAISDHGCRDRCCRPDLAPRTARPGMQT